MRQMLRIECACGGVLMVNGLFCGPLEGEGQTFPTGQNEEIYVQFFPFLPEVKPLTVAMRLREGKIIRLEPKVHAYALLWPDGIIQLELRPDGCPDGGEKPDGEMKNVLERYLTMRKAGDAQARFLLLRPEMEPALPDYDAVVPLRFAPLNTPDCYDERAGLVHALCENVARVDAALAITAPAGMGQKRIERIDVAEG